MVEMGETYLIVKRRMLFLYQSIVTGKKCGPQTRILCLKGPTKISKITGKLAPDPTMTPILDTAYFVLNSNSHPHRFSGFMLFCMLMQFIPIVQSHTQC